MSEHTASPRRIFDLDTRAKPIDPFKDVEQVRQYDRNIRSSMIIPMQHCMQLLKPFIPAGGEVLEISSSTGLMSLRLAAVHRQTSFAGIERNDHCLEVIRENTIFANLVNYGGDFAGDWAKLTHLPYDDDTFDVVFSFCALGRWLNPGAVIDEMNRVVKPGGVVFLYDLARDADEGMISFVLQYADGNADEFMNSLRSSFSVPEMADLLTERGLGTWSVQREGINMIVCSRPVQTEYRVGASGIYEDIFKQ